MAECVLDQCGADKAERANRCHNCGDLWFTSNDPAGSEDTADGCSQPFEIHDHNVAGRFDREHHRQSVVAARLRPHRMRLPIARIAASGTTKAMIVTTTVSIGNSA